MKKLILICIAGLITFAGFSQFSDLPENSDNFTISQASDLMDISHIQQIDDLYNSGKEGKLVGANDVSIYYKTFVQEGDEKGAVLISSGRTEAALKYKEVIYDLYNNGYSVYIHDHRGQGLSDRMADDHDMGYVDDFQFYIDDMKKFFDEILLKGKHGKIYLLSHSLGGAVAMAYLEQYPNDFNAASFCSPMMGFASYICPLAKVLNSKTPKYAPGQIGYHDDSTAFVGNDVTGCGVRYFRKISENTLHPESVLGGVSVQWLHQSCKQMKSTFKKVDNIEIPIVIFLAENELVVNPKSTIKFIKKAQKSGIDCTAYMISNAMHEILMEKDKQRNEILYTTLSFFASY